MKLKTSYWELFTLENENGNYISFEINKKRYNLLKDVEVFGKKNIYSIEFDSSDILTNKFLEKLDDILIKYKIKKIYFRLKPNEKDRDKIREAIKLLSNKQYIKSKINLILLNLEKEENILKKNLRKSYKSLINRENKILSVKSSFKPQNKEKIFEDWKDIHAKAILRGGKTIPLKTYDLLFKAIKAKECVVFIAYQNEECVGGMLFSLNNNFAIYESSVNIDIIENDKSRAVGHCLMWNGILELKKIGIKNFELGTYYDVTASTKYLKDWINKEDGITNFKKGFGGDIIPAYYFAKEKIK
jgi:hypothetical protein